MRTRIVSLRTFLVLAIGTIAIFVASCFVGREGKWCVDGTLFYCAMYGWPESFIVYDSAGVCVPDHGPVYILWGDLTLSLCVHALLGLAVAALYLLVFGSAELIVRRCRTGSWNPVDGDRRKINPG